MFEIGSKQSKEDFPDPTIGSDSELGQPADALSLFSREDLCEKGGGAVVFVVALALFYLAVKYWLYYTGTKRLIRSNPELDHPCRLYPPDDDGKNTSKLEKILSKAEEVFVTPYIPNSTQSFVMWIFLAYFFMTIPMAVTRYYEKRWAHDTIALQGLFNAMAFMIGCKGLDMVAIPYTEPLESAPPRYPAPPASDKWGRIDFFIMYHLAIGVLWLFLGFVQIYRAKQGDWSPHVPTHWKAHRVFGRVVLFILLLHIIMISAISWENPVNQHPLILFGYFSRIEDVIHNAYHGFTHARSMQGCNRDSNEYKMKKDKHRLYMFYTYIRGSMGSGSIRVTAWALWLVGKFLSPSVRVLLDRGDCQTYAQQGIGDATDCWKPVYINLLFTDLFVLWLELLFLTMRKQSAEHLKDERDLKRSECELMMIIIVPSLFLVVTDNIIDTPLAEFSSVIWSVIVQSDTVKHKIQEYKHLPGTDASYTSSAVRQLKKILFLPENDHCHNE